MHVLLIFVDGLGLGENDSDRNPLVKYASPFFLTNLGQSLTRDIGKVIDGRISVVPTDATLGVEGLPQSATGQTALFTGINAAKLLGQHVQGFPGPRLAKVLDEHSIMRQLIAQGYNVTSANMYSPDYMDLVAHKKKRHAAITLMALGAGQRLRTVDEMRAGQAVYQDITNEMLPMRGINDVPTVSPAVAGQRAVKLAAQHHLTIFEYFQTDRCGHKQDWAVAERIIAVLDEFFGAIYRATPENMLVVITSDHGNFEDLGIKTHTYNQVPTILWGHNSSAVADRIKDLTDITPAIVDVFGKDED